MRPELGFYRALLIWIPIMLILWILGIRKCSGFTFDISNAAEFSGGVVSSMLVHEAGHWAVLEYYDRDYRFYFSGASGVQPMFTYRGEAKNAIQMSGLSATMLSSEIILQSFREERRPFWQGFLVGAAANQILYPVLRYNTGDFKHMKGREKAWFAGLSIAHGCVTLWRLHSDGELNITSWVGSSEGGTPMAGLHIKW